MLQHLEKEDMAEVRVGQESHVFTIANVNTWIFRTNRVFSMIRVFKNRDRRLRSTSFNDFLDECSISR